ncbi:MAG: PAS domain-containing protein [Thermoplasmata archaeon]
MNDEIEYEIVRYLKDEAPVLFILLNDDKKIIEVNHYASDILDEDVVGKDIEQIFLDLDRSLDIDDCFSRSLKNKKLSLNTKTDLPDTMYFSFLSLGEKHIVFGKPDVKELEKLRDKMVSLNNDFANLSRQLQKKNAELLQTEKALEYSLNGVTITNREGIITYVNPSFLDMWGYEKGDVVGRKITKLFKDAERKDEIINKLKDKKEWIGEFKAEKKNGEGFYTRGLASTIEDDGRQMMVFTFLDITDEKKIKERRELLHSVLRHDVRNKVQIAQGYLKLLLEDFDLDDGAQDFVRKAIKSNNENINLIEKISLLLNAEKEEIKKVNIADKIEQAIEVNKSLCREKGIEISLNCTSNKCEVLGGALLKEVFSNIIENSIYHSQGDKIRISVEEMKEDTKVVIEDNGKGIPDDKKDKIFKKGYTTDEKRGTGLGLFLIRMLLNIYGGSISVKDSELGGARFDVQLKKVNS